MIARWPLLFLLLPLLACGGGADITDEGPRGLEVQTSNTPTPPVPGQVGQRSSAPILHEFANLNLFMIAPPNSELRARADSRYEVCLDCGGRSPRTVVVQPGRPDSLGPDRAPGMGRPQQQQLSNGSTLRYRVQQIEGGSGGPELHLYGAFQLATRPGRDVPPTISVECHTQAEQRPSLQWCYTLLDRIATMDGALQVR